MCLSMYVHTERRAQKLLYHGEPMLISASIENVIIIGSNIISGPVLHVELMSSTTTSNPLVIRVSPE